MGEVELVLRYDVDYSTKHPAGHGMMMPRAVLWDTKCNRPLYYHFLPDTDLHGFTQINGFYNSINIFQPEHPTHIHRTHFPEVPT